MNNNSKANDLARIILNVINEKKPKSVEELMEILNRARILNLTEEEIIKSVMKLQAEGKIKLKNNASNSASLSSYMKTGGAIWYWAIIVAEAMTATMIFTISEDLYPWIYIRNVFGVIFVLLLPGYAFTKALFPANISNGVSEGDLEKIMRIALSLGMSLASVSILGLLLYYSPLGLEMHTIVLGLLAFTSVFATVAVVREYQTKKT